MFQPWLHWLTLITAFIVGMLSAVSWKAYKWSNVGNNFQITPKSLSYDFPIERLTGLSNKNDIDNGKSEEEIRKEMASLNIVCIILVKKLSSMGIVNETWASRCNKTFFYGTRNVIPFNISSTSPNVAIVPSVVSSLQQFCQAIMIFNLNETVFQFADWIVISPDDVFYLIENLRHYVRRYNRTSLVYLGRTIDNYSRVPFNALDSSFVLSHRAFSTLLGTFGDITSCSETVVPQVGSLDRRVDAAIGLILHRWGCHPLDTRDSYGRARWLAFNPSRHLVPGNIPTGHPFWRINVYPIPSGRHCCSPQAIALPGLKSKSMMFANLILYQMKVAGINYTELHD